MKSSTDEVILANSTEEEVCGCNPHDGKCVCGENTWGPTCSFQMCPFLDEMGTGSPLFLPSYSKRSCHGQGRCDDRTGQCVCDEGFHGESCEQQEIKSETATPVRTCPGAAQIGKWCDRTSGLWTCEFGSGPLCDPPTREKVFVADWTRSMDKWGWSLCPEGSLLFGLNRGPVSTGNDVAGDALYSIESAKCAVPSAGAVLNCYHHNWWQALDSAGEAFCRQNYFVAGLFRSHCNSLYCLEMAKCCQVRHATWSDCKWTPMSSWETTRAYAEVCLREQP